MAKKQVQKVQKGQKVRVVDNKLGKTQQEIKGEATSIRIALGLALIHFIARTGLFYAGVAVDSAQWKMYIVFAHLSFLLISILAALQPSLKALQNNPKMKLPTFGDDMTKAVKAGAVYAIATAILVFIYFKFIDPAYFAQHQQALIDAEMMKHPKTDPEDVRKKVMSVFSLFNYLTITLAALLFGALAYSALATLIKRILTRKRQTQVR